MQNISESKPMFPISIVAGELKVHQRTLRIYDDEGLLVPQRSPKGRRVYSLDDLQLGKLIQAMTNSGLNLAGVKIFLLMTKEMSLEMRQEEFEKLAKEAKLEVNIQANRGRKKEQEK